MKAGIKQNVNNISDLNNIPDSNNVNIPALTQKGGYNYYNFIINPYTKEKYYLNSPKGISTLNLYITGINL